MPEGRGRSGDAGIADENIELAVALMQRSPEPGDAVKVGEVERHQRGAAAVFADLVVELFEARLRSRHRHDMRTGFCERARGGIADATRGAGDESDTGGEGGGHTQLSPSCAALCRASTFFGYRAFKGAHYFAAGFTDVAGRDKPRHNEISSCHAAFRVRPGGRGASACFRQQ